jgi:hypothetical protein
MHYSADAEPARRLLDPTLRRHDLLSPKQSLCPSNFCKAKANRCTAVRADIANLPDEKERDGISSRSCSVGDDGVVRDADQTLAKTLGTVDVKGVPYFSSWRSFR